MSTPKVISETTAPGASVSDRASNLPDPRCTGQTPFNPPEWFRAACDDPTLIFIDEIPLTWAKEEIGEMKTVKLLDEAKKNIELQHEDSPSETATLGGVSDRLVEFTQWACRTNSKAIGVWTKESIVLRMEEILSYIHGEQFKFEYEEEK